MFINASSYLQILLRFSTTFKQRSRSYYYRYTTTRQATLATPIFASISKAACNIEIIPTFISKFKATPTPAPINNVEFSLFLDKRVLTMSLIAINTARFLLGVTNRRQYYCYIQASIDLGFSYFISYYFRSRLHMCAYCNIRNYLYPIICIISIYRFFSNISRLLINILSQLLLLYLLVLLLRLRLLIQSQTLLKALFLLRYIPIRPLFTIIILLTAL